MHRGTKPSLESAKPAIAPYLDFNIPETFATLNSSQPLPIYELRQGILDALGAFSRLIVQAPAGSGKSTQVPQILLDAGLAGEGQIVILQPRRLPTRILAARVARERNVNLGQEVGYQIRFDNVSGA